MPHIHTAYFRKLPSVDEVLRSPEARLWMAQFSRAVVTDAVREALATARQAILQATDEAALETLPLLLPAVLQQVQARLQAQQTYHLRRLINATGVIVHTNLGRSLLAPAAVANLQEVAESYSNLEYDLERGERGSRYAHVEAALQTLTGAEAALVVNNNAAAVFLALQALATGREVVVSRGQLIEIGGEFRIPDIMRSSGAILREVGATNKTHLRDYAQAISEHTALLLRVHTSNYRIVGFTAEVSAQELVELGHKHQIPVMEDLGSGTLVDLRPFGLYDEPTVPEVVASGVDIVAFSGDKLLGGPQAGIVVGRAELVERLARNPLNRALRIDKFTVAALEGTLYAYEAGEALETIPTLRMLTEPPAAIRRRARGLLRRLTAEVQSRLGAMLVDATSQVGGGALPTVELPTVALALGSAERRPEDLDDRLRAARPPVLGRLLDDRLLLDFRTVLPADVPALAATLASL